MSRDPEIRLVDAEPGAWSSRLAERLVADRTLARYGDPVAARERADAVVAEVLPRSRVLEVVADDAVVGHVWLVRDGESVDVGDVGLDDPALGPTLRETVLGLVAADGVTMLNAGVVPGHAAREAFVAGGGFTLMATNLRLDLADAPDRRHAEVRLDPMSEQEFDHFMRDQTASYAAERAASGESPERAERTAREQLAALLPEGRHSDDQHLFTVRAGEGVVGDLWLATDTPTVFVYDVVVRPDLRGRGQGRALMETAESWARDRGAIGVGLNVFAPNTVARGLYDALGYRVVEDLLFTAVEQT